MTEGFLYFTVDKQGVKNCISVLKKLCNDSAYLFCFFHVGNGCKPVQCYNVFFGNSRELTFKLFPRDDVALVG